MRVNINLFQSENYTHLIEDLHTIKSVRTSKCDKLALNTEGKLILTPGGFLQGPNRTIKNLFYGGYNRLAVAAKLEEITKKNNFQKKHKLLLLRHCKIVKTT